MAIELLKVLLGVAIALISLQVSYYFWGFIFKILGIDDD